MGESVSVGSCPVLSPPQSPGTADRMRVCIVACVLMLALGLATSFRVNDVIHSFEDFVENPDRQSDDINDNIPAVFAATLGASLLANVLFGKKAAAPQLNKLGKSFR